MNTYANYNLRQELARKIVELDGLDLVLNDIVDGIPDNVVMRAKDLTLKNCDPQKLVLIVVKKIGGGIL